MSFAKGAFDAGFEAVELIIRHERERRSCEAAAMDTHRALTRQQLLAQRDCERHVLLLDAPRRDHVLKQRPRRHAGLIDIV